MALARLSSGQGALVSSSSLYGGAGSVVVWMCCRLGGDSTIFLIPQQAQRWSQLNFCAPASSQPRWQPAHPSPGTSGLAEAETRSCGLSTAVSGKLFWPDFPHHFNVYPVAWHTPPENGIRTAVFWNGHNPARCERLEKVRFSAPLQGLSVHEQYTPREKSQSS